MLQNRLIQVAVSEQIGCVVGVAHYSASELSLRYSPDKGLPETYLALGRSGVWRQSGDRVFVTAGFLTLTFDGSPPVFTTLDAYANRDRWLRSRFITPVATRHGGLLLVDDRLSDGRMSLEMEPVYEMSDANNAVRIRFDLEDRNVDYVEIGTGVIAGIHDAQLTELVLSTVRFD